MSSPDRANLALRRPALQSSTSQGSADPSPAVDALIATSGDLESTRCFHTGNERFPWWQVDLGRDCLIDRVEILNRQDRQHQLTRFTLLGSLDGVDFVPLQRARFTAAERYAVDLAPPRLARFLRVRLDGGGELHFRQCLVFGAQGDAPDQRAAYAAAAARAKEIPQGREGEVLRIDGFDVFVDDNYAPEIREALRGGSYEDRERNLVCRRLKASARVIEAGTAIGLVAMTAAAIAGAERVLTFDANPEMVADAKANFARNGMAIKARYGALVARSRYVEGERLAFQVSPSFWASRLGGDGAMQTPTFCLEDEIAASGADTLICDIEGGEIDLLMHADLSAIQLIILETHSWAVGAAATYALVRKLILDGFSLDVDVSEQAVLALRR